MILAILLLLFVPQDGGNHPRKDQAQPVNAAYQFNEPTGFHPPKSLDQ